MQIKYVKWSHFKAYILEVLHVALLNLFNVKTKQMSHVINFNISIFDHIKFNDVVNQEWSFSAGFSTTEVLLQSFIRLE